MVVVVAVVVVVVVVVVVLVVRMLIFSYEIRLPLLKRRTISITPNFVGISFWPSETPSHLSPNRFTHLRVLEGTAAVVTATAPFRNFAGIVFLSFLDRFSHVRAVRIPRGCFGEASAQCLAALQNHSFCLKKR